MEENSFPEEIIQTVQDKRYYKDRVSVVLSDGTELTLELQSKTHKTKEVVMWMKIGQIVCLKIGEHNTVLLSATVSNALKGTEGYVFKVIGHTTAPTIEHILSCLDGSSN